MLFCAGMELPDYTQALPGLHHEESTRVIPGMEVSTGLSCQPEPVSFGRFFWLH